MSTIRFDRMTLDRGRRTPEGHLVCDAAIARIGVQEYSGAMGPKYELRHSSEVFDPTSMASLRGVPIVVNHPGTELIKPDDKRAVGFVGQDVRRDGDFLVATVTITDPSTIKQIDAGELAELSSGYETKVVEGGGIAPCGKRYDRRQTRIRHNHVALLPKGGARCGSACSLRIDAARSDAAAAFRRMVDYNTNLWRQPFNPVE